MPRTVGEVGETLNLSRRTALRGYVRLLSVNRGHPVPHEKIWKIWLTLDLRVSKSATDTH